MQLQQKSFRTDPPESPPDFLFESESSLMADTVELSGPMEVDLSIYRGDTGRFSIKVTKQKISPVYFYG